MKSKIYRQGDLLIKAVSAIPGGVIPSKDKILLKGEATGHAHRLENGLVFRENEYGIRFRGIERKVFIKVENGGRIVHEEHDTIHLPKGIFQIIRQREYTPTGWVNVLD